VTKRAKDTSRDFAKVAANYARDVVAGRLLACELVKRACERHLAGLRAQRTKEYPYKLDAAAATKVCRFVELLPHVKGKWARGGERLHLEPWQAFILANVFGWKRKRDGLRRYRRVYIEVPRKNAKSTTTAAVADYMLVADGEHGAEVYSGATTEKQAWEVFGPARLMVTQTPALREAYGVTAGAKNLHVVSTASKFEPIIGKPGDGASPSFAVTDEYHEHTTPEQYETMLTGMGAREQPIAWVITTAGADTAGPCYALRQQATDMLEGKVEYDDLFALVYTIDADDDWTSPAAVRKANPNLGVSVSEEFLLTAQRRAISDPREQATFKTKHLNVWVTAAAPYFNAEAWKRLGDPSLDPSQFAGQRCFLALDLASTQDVSGKIKLFRRMIDGAEHFYAFGRFFIPQRATEKPEQRHYAGWVESGHMIATPGDMTDYDYIEADIKDDATRHEVVQLGYDRWDASQVVTHVKGFLGDDKVVQVPQTTEFLSHPMKTLSALIDAGRIHHTGDPVLAWMIGNVSAQVDRHDNVFPRKERAERKIDGAVALIVALSCALRQPATDVSIYDSEELFVL
jgi:phage terminase large subunit-like protein